MAEGSLSAQDTLAGRGRGKHVLYSLLWSFASSTKQARKGGESRSKGNKRQSLPCKQTCASFIQIVTTIGLGKKKKNTAHL